MLGDTLYARLFIVRPSNQCLARTIAINTPKQRHPQQGAVEGSASGSERRLLNLDAIATRRARAAFQHAGAKQRRGAQLSRFERTV